MLPELAISVSRREKKHIFLNNFTPHHYLLLFLAGGFNPSEKNNQIGSVPQLGDLKEKQKSLQPFLNHVSPFVGHTRYLKPPPSFGTKKYMLGNPLSGCNRFTFEIARSLNMSSWWSVDLWEDRVFQI